MNHLKAVPVLRARPFFRQSTASLFARHFRYDNDSARMAKSADAADLKSAGPQGLWGFKSPSGHHESVRVIAASVFSQKALMQKGFAFRDCGAPIIAWALTRFRGHILNCTGSVAG